MPKLSDLARPAALFAVLVSLGGCGSMSGLSGSGRQLSEQECLARVMYFESNRSSDDGMLAVGTVVMNRLQSPRYPKTICGVVGQSNQFAEGALSNHVNRRSTSWTRAERVANAVISGNRHSGVGSAMFFHTAGYTFPYRNMHYLTLAGGNVFYEKKTPGTFTPGFPWASTMVASAEPISPRRRAPEPDWSAPTPTVVAAVARQPRPISAAAPTRLAAATPAPVVAVAVPPAKPKPIVVAMLSDPKPRASHPPRSIEDLIAMDVGQR